MGYYVQDGKIAEKIGIGIEDFQFHESLVSIHVVNDLLNRRKIYLRTNKHGSMQ